MDQPGPDDAELVTESLAGNREAFGILYDRHARIVRAIVLAVARDWAASDDMVQETFLRAYGKLASLRDPAMFGPWVAGIARHVARERRRSLRRDRHKAFQQDATEVETGCSLQSDEPMCEQLSDVRRHLAELPERERLAIHAFFLDGVDAKRASAMLGLSRSGFYGLLQRAIAQLAMRIRLTEVGKERT
jgi:RNA polymerase sigma-70 factor (ECF subfamily)